MAELTRMIGPLTMLAATFAGAFVIALALTPAVLRFAPAVGAMDLPGGRKVHTAPVPRLGGVAVIVAVIAGAIAVVSVVPSLWIIARGEAARWAIVGAATVGVTALGAVDDVKSLSARAKFAAQSAAALLVSAFALPSSSLDLSPFGPAVELGIAMPLLGALWIVAVTNAFNMTDGLDGLAGGLGAIAAAALAAACWVLGSPVAAVALVTTSGALAGFLPFNFRPARIFLGDSGSLGVGFVLGAVTLVGLQRAGSWLAFPAVLALGLPLVDLCFAVLRRGWQAVSVVRAGEGRERYRFGRNGWPAFFTADRRHIHHRLIDLGLSPCRAVLLLFPIGVALGALAVTSIRWPWVGSLAAFGLVAACVYFAPKWLYDELRVFQKGALLPLFEHALVRSRLFHVAFDLWAVTLSYLLSRAFAEGLAATVAETWSGVYRTGAISLFTLLGLYLGGLYRGAYRHAGLSEILRVGRAVLFGIVLGAGAQVLIFRIPLHPAVWVIHFYVTLSLILGARLSFRLLDHIYQRARSTGRRALIYGAGRAGDLALREILANPELQLVPIGFVDDEPSLWGRAFDGYVVHPGGAHLGDIVDSHAVQDLVISTRKIAPNRLAEVSELCARRGVRVLYFGLEWSDGMVVSSVVPQERRAVGDASRIS